MPWRLKVDKDVVGEFNESTNYVLEEIKMLEQIARKIRRYDIDGRSDAYFSFLISTIEQLRNMIYIPRVHKKMKTNPGTR